MARLCPRILGSESIEHADAPHALAMLRPRRERPRRRAAIWNIGITGA